MATLHGVIGLFCSSYFSWRWWNVLSFAVFLREVIIPWFRGCTLSLLIIVSISSVFLPVHALAGFICHALLNSSLPISLSLAFFSPVGLPVFRRLLIKLSWGRWWTPDCNNRVAASVHSSPLCGQLVISKERDTFPVCCSLPGLAVLSLAFLISS